MPYVPRAAPAPVAPPAPSSVRGHDYSCIDNGQPFVAPGWVSEELLNALRADARQLLDAGRFVDAEENLGKRIKLSLDEEDWTAPGEAPGQPSPARAEARRLFDELLLELEAVLGRGPGGGQHRDEHQGQHHQQESPSPTEGRGPRET